MSRISVLMPILAGGGLRDRSLACCGALLGIALTGLLCSSLTALPLRDVPLLVAPIGASAVLVFAVPASPLAQPWPVFGGNVISALVGVVAAHLIPNPALAAAFAVAGAILAMSLLRCLHPPGGAAALTAVVGGPVVLSAGYMFPFIPVGINSAVLLLIGYLFHQLSGHSYPHRAQTVKSHGTSPIPRVGFHPQAIDRALADLGDTFDISRADLDLLLQRAAFYDQKAEPVPPGSNRPASDVRFQRPPDLR